MRAVTFSSKKLAAYLKRNFVCTWYNQAKDLFPATPKGANDKKPAVSQHYLDSFPDGGGGANVRLFFLTPDRRIVHYTEGHYRPDSLMREARFALDLLNRTRGKPRDAALGKALVARHAQRRTALALELKRLRKTAMPKEADKKRARQLKSQLLSIRMKNHTLARARILKDPKPFMINECLAIV